MKPSSSINSTDYKGLSEQEALERLKKDGPNELPAANPRNFFTISLDVIKEPMFILLVLCCTLYIILGDLEQALILSVFVAVIIGITLFQSWKTESTLNSLKELSSPKSLVIRDSQELYIPSRELVIDDILILNEGDKVAADVIVLNTANLMVDESSLTGESVPVRKNIWEEKSSITKPGEEGGVVVYNGTLITQGMAYTKIIAIGKNTELGKIGSALKSITKNDSRFQLEVAKLVNRMLIIAGVLCLVIIGCFALRNDLLKGLLTSITFAIAMLPEEIPAVLTIFMALGAFRISQKNVLTRKMSAIETLGSITVLCSDKTGTITENKMKLSEVFHQGESYKITEEPLPEKFHHLIEFAILASKENSFDPMEKALMKMISTNLVDSEHLHQDWKLIQEYPLSKDLSAMSRAWEKAGEAEKSKFSFYSKGSPEAIFDLCHLNTDEIKELTAAEANLASRGLRVLGVAKSKSTLEYTPGEQHDIDFEFCGLLGFSDPIRPGVKEAVADCYSAGIKVIMITGDYHITAQNIATEIGLKNPDKFITGNDLAKLSDEELQARIKDISIFSRVIPEQKLRIINALRTNQEIIAMTGDGVNDAPALKSSDVGIAMGATGTNVARESADLILLDDNFSSIVSAIKLGRRIFENLRKAMSYIVAVHIPIAGLTLIPVIFSSLPTIFFPIHVAFLELIIDPTCSIVFEAEPATKDSMLKAPRKTTEPILNHKKLITSVLQGFSVLLLVLGVYLLAVQAKKPEGEIRLLSFGTLLIGNFFLALVNKSWTHKSISEAFFENKAFLIVLLVVISSFSLIVFLPSLRHWFYF
ncbi:MAG: cation-translocating P-type ATPase [Vampirovibrionia bacterium]